MSKIIVADTGPLIALARLELLATLAKLFSSVYVPDQVVAEATRDPNKPGASTILFALEQHWLKQQSIDLDSRLENLSKVLDLGEAEAIALAEQLGAIVLIDERRGRSVAKQRNIPITGTAAILIKAKQAGEVAQVKPLLDTLDKVGYRLSPALINEVLKIIGEN